MTDRQSTCPRCQALLPAEAAACPACGASFSATASEFAERKREEHEAVDEQDAARSEEAPEVPEPSLQVSSQPLASAGTGPLIDVERLEKLTSWNMALVLMFFGFLLMTSFT